MIDPQPGRGKHAASPEMTTRRRLVTALVLLGSFVAVLIVAATVIPSHNGQLLDVTADHSEPLTELYFDHGGQLPTTYRPGAHQTVRFTIHNVEGKAVTYTYIVSVNNKPVTVSKSLTLANGAARDVSADVDLDVASRRAHVNVELTNISQAVGYWVTRE